MCYVIWQPFHQVFVTHVDLDIAISAGARAVVRMLRGNPLDVDMTATSPFAFFSFASWKEALLENAPQVTKPGGMPQHTDEGLVAFVQREE